MLTHPTRNALRALTSLQQSSYWNDIEEFLQAEIAELHKQLAVTADEAILRQMQGRTQFATQFLNMVRDASATLEKLKG